VQPRLLAEAPGKLPAWVKERAAAARRELARREQPAGFGF